MADQETSGKMTASLTKQIIGILFILSFAAELHCLQVEANDDLDKDMPMEESPFAPWDFNYDGKCDDYDLGILDNLIGKCDLRTANALIADIDFDGCVTEKDRETILTDACWNVEKYYSPYDI